MIPSTEESFAQYAILSEPQLEFGQPRSHKAEESDPQKGLEKHGPYSTRLGGKWHPAKTTLVPIAADDDWVEVIQGLNRLRSFQQIEQPTYTARIDFPGFESAFRSKLTIVAPKVPGSQALPATEFEKALSLPSAATGYRRVLSIIDHVLGRLSPLPDSAVAALYLPRAIVEKFRRFTPDFQPVPKNDDTHQTRGSGATIEPPDSVRDSEDTLFHDLRRSIKLMCMRRDIACQILTNNFLDDDEAIPWAGKLWNLGTSLFCKAGGIPWRVTTAENVAYCGIRFGITKNPRGQSILVGLAQVFNGAGELVALRAGRALRNKSQSENGYYLSQEQARTLLSDVIADYQSMTGLLPDRIVIHKSSPFKSEEIQGAEEAAAGVRELDLIYIKDGSGLRLIPDRGMPANRGTVVPTSPNSALVYTTGTEFDSGKWRGMHVPKPYEIVRYSRRSLHSLLENARDVLRMTKMNWNTTLYYRREPCTFTNATEVIGMLKEFRADDVLKPNIRYYI